MLAEDLRRAIVSSSDCTAEVSSKHIANALYGLRSIHSPSRTPPPAVLSLLSSLATLINASTSPLTAAAVGNGFYGLQVRLFLSIDEMYSIYQIPLIPVNYPRGLLATPQKSALLFTR